MTDEHTIALSERLVELAEGAKAPVRLYASAHDVYRDADPAVVKLADAILLIAEALRAGIGDD